MQIIQLQKINRCPLNLQFELSSNSHSFWNKFYRFLKSQLNSIQCIQCVLQQASLIFQNYILMEEDNNQESCKAEMTLEHLSVLHQSLSSLLEENTNLRMKYSAEPMKYYKSEEEMFRILQSLLEEELDKFIGVIVPSNIIVNIIKILSHPNEDLYGKCVQILYDILNEEPEDDLQYKMIFTVLLEGIEEHNLYGSLVQILIKNKEQDSLEDYEIAHKVLKIIESCSYYHENSISILLQEEKFIQYLANRILPNYVVKYKTIDDNKYVSSDILAMLLTKTKGQEIFLSMSGVEILVECIGAYCQGKQFPSNSDEQEYLLNLFDCLNILLISSAKGNKKVFHQMEGNQLMIYFLKAKNIFSVHALKIINNSLNISQKQKAIEKLIDLGILKYVFAILMRQGLKGSDVDEQKAIDENVLGIIYSVIKSATQIYKVRVDSKFSEKRYQKLERLFQIRDQYAQSLGSFQGEKSSQKQVLKQEEYLKMIEDGLNIIEIIYKILCTLANGNQMICNRVVELMKIFKIRIEDLQWTFKNAYNFVAEGSYKLTIELLLSKYLSNITKNYNQQQN